MAFSKATIKKSKSLLTAIAKWERKQNFARAALYKRAEGKLVIIGWGLDRVMGIFSTLDKALEAVESAPERNDHNWWIAFRKMDRWEKSNIFERVLIRTIPKSGS